MSPRRSKFAIDDFIARAYGGELTALELAQELYKKRVIDFKCLNYLHQIFNLTLDEAKLIVITVYCAGNNNRAYDLDLRLTTYINNVKRNGMKEV